MKSIFLIRNTDTGQFFAGKPGWGSEKQDPIWRTSWSDSPRAYWSLSAAQGALKNMSSLCWQDKYMNKAKPVEIVEYVLEKGKVHPCKHIHGRG